MIDKAPVGSGVFGAKLKDWRERRGVPLRQFAGQVGYSFGQIAKVEQGRRRASRELAERCDAALNAGGELLEAWTASAGLVRPSQLPLGPARLEGRALHLARLDQALTGGAPGTPPVIVINGPAGSGKTALALYRAHRATDQFVDGQLYADLDGFSPPTRRPTTPDTVLQWWCQTLRAPHIPSSLAEKAAMFRSLLRDRKILILLDNAASTEQVEPLLPNREGCAVIITSRRALTRLVVQYDAHRVSVGPLADDDAVNLVRYLIGGHRADAESDAVRRLAQLCGNLPLALRIAADLVLRYPHRRIADLAADLDAQETRLDVLETDDELTLRAVLSWSYHELSPQAAHTFELLGLHDGSTISTHAVSALAATSLTDTRHTLNQLASLHLVEMLSPNELTMHELVRDYASTLAQRRLPAKQRKEAIERLSTWHDTTRTAG